ncbi:MAG: altronate dehydratase family protein [Gemmatimonadetes bacterium]|nr:altronate dehydratase family protein [Gemmatimonadota bacterium]
MEVRHRPDVVHVHPADNVAVALDALAAGQEIELGGERLLLRDDVPAGHKIALRRLAAGEPVLKYGFEIGRATEETPAGAWIHSHNLRTALEGVLEYRYHPVQRDTPAPAGMPTFMGYRRPNGRVGTRNEIWIVNTVGCVNTAAERIARSANERFKGRVDGVHAFSHPYGCSQLGDDLTNTQRVLAGLIRHPNAGGVLVLGLGCENNQMASLLAMAGEIDQSRLRFFNTQEVVDEVEEGLEAVEELVRVMERDQRVECPASDLIIGHKCGGSDGFSGISANPLVGRIADRVTALGGGVILTEVPEMFGAEQVLMNRAASEEVFREIVSMVNDFKEYFLRHNQPVYENPSPGNKAGGLTTLEEKSLGAIQKGGQATVRQVLRYGEPATTGGLSLLEAPGNDGVSSTAMVASGATILLFTTGRGTPLGFPVPTLKIASNTAIAEKKPHWIDFSAGALLDGTATIEELADRLFAKILDVASGRQLANNEQNGYREIAIWKEGVTL